VNKNIKKSGFTLIEMLVVIGIIGILVAFIAVSIFGSRAKARDAKRKLEIAQLGRFFTMACFLPNDGEGEYDLLDIAQEIITDNPRYSKFFSNIPRDPKTGTPTESKYIYVVNAIGDECALYANLENLSETLTLTITVPTPAGGTGVFEADSPGWNGTSLYFQVSN